MTTWKPGDIALVTFDNATGSQRDRGISRIETKRAIVAEHNGSCSDDRLWFVFDASSRIGVTWPEVVEARRLVFIDPGSDDQIVALHLALLNHGWRADADADTSAALREFAKPKPPKPEEPLHIGAVVRSSDRYMYVRVALPYDGWAAGEDWQRVGGAVNSIRNFGWAQIDAVEVLSEGVTE